MNLVLTLEDRRPQAVVRALGEIDLYTAPRLQAALSAAAESRPARLLVDMSGVEFIDCAGVRALLRAEEACRRRRVRLVVTGLRRSARRLIAMLGADQRLRGS